MTRILVLSALIVGRLHAADVCVVTDVAGPYAFQLTGTSTISGSPAPLAGIARLEFDGKDSVSGYSSVNFNGLLLGNPVTGDYQITPDCKLTWRLQDDSGGYQHFAGAIKPGATHIDVRQTDPGSGARGSLEKASAACSPADFLGRYSFTLAGVSTTLVTGGPPRSVSIEGTADADGTANISVAGKGLQGAGTFEVDADCISRIEIQPTDASRITLRGVLANGGAVLLSIRTEPGESVAARFTRRAGGTPVK